jgi:glutathione S-transferase
MLRVMPRKLYTCLGSGNAYKAELMLHLLNLEYDSVTINIPKGEHNNPEFLALTPFGQIPVLVDGSETFTDSQAILCYLARKYGGAKADHWLPIQPVPLAHVMRWLSVAANEIQNSLTLARAIKRLGWARDYNAAVARGYKILALMDAHLRDRLWLATEAATVADIACYPYVLLAPEGGIDIEPYVHVIKWLRRIEAVAGFWPMPRIPGLPPIPLMPSPHK